MQSALIVALAQHVGADLGRIDMGKIVAAEIRARATIKSAKSILLLARELHSNRTVANSFG
jgi:hypothetical protein